MQEEFSKTRMAKRGIWYFMRTIFIIALVLVLAVGVFITAMRISNIYIIATEGLQLRMNQILREESLLTMQEYFTPRFLSEDPLLRENDYDDYDITSFDYRLEVKSFLVWPWSTTAELTVVEHMRSISGKILESRIPENAVPDAEYPVPEWEEGEYRVHFILQDDRWYIDRLEWLAPAEEAPAEATPMVLPEEEAGE